MHSSVRQMPELQPLLRTTPCYGIFNDHDFGTPDADRTFVFAQESLVAFQRFWPRAQLLGELAPGPYPKLLSSQISGC